MANLLEKDFRFAESGKGIPTYFMCSTLKQQLVLHGCIIKDSHKHKNKQSYDYSGITFTRKEYSQTPDLSCFPGKCYQEITPILYQTTTQPDPIPLRNTEAKGPGQHAIQQMSASQRTIGSSSRVCCVSTRPPLQLKTQLACLSTIADSGTFSTLSWDQENQCLSKQEGKGMSPGKRQVSSKG